MNMFRVLRADEIDCRIAQIKRDGSGLSLLLYKDARCDQNILDETVGAMNWERRHSRDNANCTVSIWDDKKQMWISKEDTGTESNTEREKGLASDSFKRACFNWGIGRELYTAPFIWISAKDCNIKEGKCYDRFTVKGIGYTDGVITGLEIKNQATGKICYKWGKIDEEAPEKPEAPDTGEPIEHLPPAPGVVSTVAKVPDSPEMVYLASEMKELRQDRKISMAENKEIFNKQKAALVAAGMAPDKPIQQYSIPEIADLIDAMRKNFTTKGTELIA